MVLQNMFTRPGYEFTGWNTEKNGAGTPYAAGSAITIKNTDVTLYAQWKSSTASYRVEYYQQNLKDDNYSIVAADTLTPSGTVGDTATAEIKEYEGFTYNESRSNCLVKIFQRNKAFNRPLVSSVLVLLPNIASCPAVIKTPCIAVP